MRPVDLAGIAFLTAGPRRVVEVAIARLVETGALRASRGGQIAAVAQHAGHPIDAAVLYDTGHLPRQLDTVVRRVAVNPAVTAVGDALVAQRLLIAPSTARAVQRRSVLALYVLLVIGVVRLANGLMRDYAVGYLIGLLALTLLAIVVLHRRRLPARTVHGDRVVRAARRGPQSAGSNPWLPPTLGLASTAGVVALGGLMLYPDVLVREQLAVQAVTQSSSSWGYSGSDTYSSCGSSSSSSSSDGGSSSGGSDSGGSSGGGGGCGGGCGSS